MKIQMYDRVLHNKLIILTLFRGVNKDGVLWLFLHDNGYKTLINLVFECVIMVCLYSKSLVPNTELYCKEDAYILYKHP